ncbi:Uncharacterized protein APZ42_013765 [Daphnia magna]|uniref:Peptidase A2 domain-containing protein n=1 Tax=Daphnia magna TaxID=35525 RepID=A0A162QIF4_9CRUS|nr:Uncharacterized protein APZ42_013765 [Daphnia magna]
MFLRAFQPQHYGRYQEAKLRQRKQGIDESGVEYFYDVIDLCRRLDPGMLEEAKVEYLFRGLKPTLVEKIWVTSPRTTVEFLTAAVSMLGPMKGLPPLKEEVGTELRDLVLELKAEITGVEKGQDQKSVARKKMGRVVSGVIVETRERTDEETIGVRKMERPGRLGDGTPKKMTRTPWVSADEDDSGEAAVLLINSSRLITEEVVSQGIRIKAVIDTGAVVSVASPSLQEKLGARRMGWDGPSVVMVNGQRAPPLGALELEIEHRGMKASGKVILLEMRGIELLLGNDFLSRFKRLQIN